MRTVMCLIASLSLVVSCQAQGQLTDLKSLIGRKAVAQRMPFYQPGTFQTIPNTYAGQTVTIIDAKPSAMFASIPKLTARQMASLPPQSRENIENVRNAAVLVVQFADGTKADTGSMPVMASTLPSYLEVIADPQGSSGPVVVAPVAAPAMNPSSGSAIALTKQECPVVVTKASSTNGGFGHAFADSLTKSEFERAVEKANNGGNDPHYLDVRMHNGSDKPIRAIEAFAVYSNSMGDEGERTSLLTQNNKGIKPGGEYKCYAVDTSVRSANGIGDVRVFVARIRFEDDTFWQDDGSQSCSLTARIK